VATSSVGSAAPSSPEIRGPASPGRRCVEVTSVQSASMRPDIAARIVARAVRGDRPARYRIAEALARRIHPDALLSEEDRVWMADQDFRFLYSKHSPANWRRLDRVWSLREYARAVRPLSGITVECGVYQGLSSYVIRQAAGKEHHGFDSFEGLSSPGLVDGSHWSEGALASPEAAARALLAEYPDVHLHRGWIPDRFGILENSEVCLAHIDVDLYEPTRASVEFFWPRLVVHGVMVLDDYGMGQCPGALKAVDEFFDGRDDVRFIHLPTGQGIAERLR
jgi:O-methyltransferase